jgi:hypothetical protein
MRLRGCQGRRKEARRQRSKEAKKKRRFAVEAVAGFG